MSVRKLTAKLIAALILVGASVSIPAELHAQQNDLPPVDPFAFDPDFRWFEPVYEADLIDMKPIKRANTGWFATYDRLFLYGSRSELNVSTNGAEKLDAGAGHRYELGYMTPNSDSGWLFNWTNNGVTSFDTTRRERLNRYSASDFAITGITGGSGTAGDSPIQVPLGIIIPQADANNLGFFRRFFDDKDSLNVFELDSYEFNKTWRMEPYHYGGIMEPMVGVRWMRLDDTNMRSTFNTTQELLNPLVIGGFLGAAEQSTINLIETENEMVLGQLGFRYFKNRGKFTYSSDFRVFAGQNFQCAKQQLFTETTIYNLTANTVTIGDAPVAQEASSTTPVFNRNDEFVVGFDLRGELGYQLTKMISVRGGFQVVDIGRGVWRGGTEGRDDQDVQLLGATFGLTLNR